MKPIGLLGGTFDPVHHGHLRLALELYEALGLGSVRLIPLHTPPHREAPVASPELRFAMLWAAVQGEPALIPDDRELRRGGISYTVDTLRDLRQELGDDVPLCLLLGMDAFCGLNTWHCWRSLIELAHFAVAHRPEMPAPKEREITDLLNRHLTDNPADLHRAPAGRIVVLSIPPLDISASGIRSLVAAGRRPRYLLPDSVIQLIEETKLYRSDEQNAG